MNLLKLVDKMHDKLLYSHYRVSRLTETDRNEPKRTETDRNGPTKIPKRTSMGTETDRNGLQWVPKTDRNRLQVIPKRTSMGTRKGRVGYDRNDPNKIMYVWVCR